VTADTGIFCGDGVINGNEECDGSQLGGKTCQSQGFQDGTLSCTDNCTFDTTGCSNCGDGILNGHELCDGNQLGGKTCMTEGFVGGQLTCTSDCASFDTSACHNCGNGVIDPSESCDGFQLGTEACSTLGFDGGTLACRSDCTFNTDACYACGDGEINGSEQCEGTQLGGASCATLGFAGGVLACSPGCTFDTGACFKCGDGVINGSDQCDGNQLGGASCASLAFSGGTLACSPSCTFDSSACYHATDTCGAAVPITLTGAQTVLTGDTTGSLDEFATVDCGDPWGPWPGGQHYCRVSLKGGKAYQATLTPAGWDSALYAFPASTPCDATAINAACVGYSNDVPGFSLTEAVGILPQVDEDWIIVVDSFHDTQFGSYTLTITNNDLCDGAFLLPLNPAGKATVTGNTSGTTTNVATLSSSGCTGYSSPGPDLFYAVSMPASSTFTVTLTPDSDFDPMLYLFTDCAAPEATCVAGSDIFGSSAVETLIVIPATDTLLLIGVDSFLASEVGAFTLTVEQQLSTLLAFNFDSSNCSSGLTASGDWECGTISFFPSATCDGLTPVPPPSGHSGMGMYGTRLNDCYSPLGNNADESTCSNIDPADDSVLTFTAALPSTWTTTALTYWSWEDFNLPWDWAEVRVNGLVVESLCGDMYVPPAAWIEKVVDLSPYIGQTVEVAFHFMASLVVNQAGWYIDDVEVKGF
jgi:hypothetical protein